MPSFPQPGLNISNDEKFTLDRAMRASVRLGGLDLQYLTFSIADSIDGIFPSIKLGPNGIIFNDNTTLTSALDAGLPSQVGQNGKYLTTDGTDASWGAITGIVGLSSNGSLITATLPFQMT